MRIVLDARTVQDHFPGIARYTFNLARALSAVAPHDDLLLLLQRAQPNSRYDLAALGALPNMQLIASDARVFGLQSQWRVPAHLRALHADVYHSPYYLMPYVMRRATCVTVHDLIPLLYPHYFSAFQRLIFVVTLRLAVRTAQRVIAVSQQTARDLRAHLRVPPAKLKVIAEAADPDFAPATHAAIAAVRALYTLPESYVLYLGSNKPHKNLSRLIEAYALVHQRAHLPLVIAGHWDARQNAPRALAARLGLGESVRWLGQIAQTDLPALYSGARLFAFPSEYEGVGLPVLEAMACGVPVLCSNTGALAEVAGEAALLLDPHDTQAWRATIEEIMADDARRAEMSARGLQRARAYSWERTAQQTYEAYVSARQSLVKSRPTS